MIKWTAVAVAGGVSIAVAALSAIAMRWALSRLEALANKSAGGDPRPRRFVFWRRLLVYAAGILASLAVMWACKSNWLAASVVIVSQCIAVTVVGLFCFSSIKRLEIHTARLAAWLTAASITGVALAAVPFMEPFARYVTFENTGDGPIGLLFWPVYAPLALFVMLVYAAIQASAAMMVVAVVLNLQRLMNRSKPNPPSIRTVTLEVRYEFRPAVSHSERPNSPAP